MRNILIGMVIGGALMFGYTSLKLPIYTTLEQSPIENTIPEDENDIVCIQVITSARDPESGIIKEFSTPCEVPSGWEIIQNEEPNLNLDLEVN